MHKGYAFVQFTTPFDARNACHGEDGRSVLSQVLGKFYVKLTVTIVIGHYAQPRRVRVHF